MKPKSLNKLIKTLKTDKNWTVRRDAAQALSMMGPDAKPAIPALIKALKDENWDVRRAASQALGKIAPAAIPALIEALKHDENGDVRYRAAQALSMMGPDAKPAIPALIEALEDENLDVRHAAAQALENISSKALTPESPKLSEGLQSLLDLTVSEEISPEDLSKLLSALNQLHQNLSGQPLKIHSIKIGLLDYIFNAFAWKAVQ